MCARLLACPLCSQPGFLTLDALRTGLVSVATRPLACPVCNEVLLGIDKLTIHLFGHTINTNNLNVNQSNVQILHNIQAIPVQTWNILKAQNLPELTEKTTFDRQKQESFILKDNEMIINSHISHDDQNNEPKQVIFLQNMTTDQIYPTSCGFSKNPPQKRIEKQIVNSESHEINSLVQSRQSLVRNSNLNPDNGNLIPSGNLIQENKIQSNLVENSVLTQDTNLFESSVSLLQTNSILPKNLTSSQNKSNLAPTNTFGGTNLQQNSNFLPNNLQENSNTLGNDSNEKSLNLQVGTINNSWIENNSGTTTATGNLNEIEEIPIEVNESEKNSNNENNARDCEKGKTEEVENEGKEKSQDPILPYLKAFRLLASNEKMERCNICGYRCDDRKILILHKQLVHMIAEKDMNVRPEDLLKNYPCHLCTKVFKMRGSLMVHMRVAHTNYNSGCLTIDPELSPNNENGYNCPICGKNFKKEQHVTQHLKTHDGKQWECDICSKMFTTKYFLKKHKRLHSGEMPYKCNICDKTFTFQQSYHKHRLYHKDDKPHTCNTCGRSFKELSTLHNHERIHTGEKPFACETCGKCFRQRVSYLVHRRIHTGVMPYKCTSCGKCFRYKVSQRTHKCQIPAENLSQNSEILFQRLLQISEPKEKNNELLEEETQRIEAKCSERNKFILLMNEEGEPILTRQSDLNNAKEKEIPTESINKENSKKEENLWIQERNNVNSSNSLKEQHVDREKLQLEVPQDIFSMMLLPSEKDAPTPSTEMEHLRLSSPIQKESEIIENYNDNHNKLEIMGISRENIRERFENNIANSLRTIDDASLSELIYGISQE
ncbi:zinc finger protein 624 [Leptopilina heterotoma]|uniref:zinc finger protein 624 n=1 Tax=Leptopilina heterotoma TaxID=63436 RepID=UPI001CAA3203|nr:zinc finger protein 624 [Leptopilina heterotoma]